jgi:long-chain acyl-CoA synthetase
VVAETIAGRLEAVLLMPPPPSADAPAAGEAADLIRRANRILGVHQRLSGARVWPEPDFPRTHTLKVRREPVVAWLRSAASAPTALARVVEPV